jgi:hypothetical protein
MEDAMPCVRPLSAGGSILLCTPNTADTATGSAECGSRAAGSSRKTKKQQQQRKGHDKVREDAGAGELQQHLVSFSLVTVSSRAAAYKLAAVC